MAPIPGETKVWQYITLMKRIYLIDCPGVVPPSKNDSEEDILLRGVVRVENVQNPGQYIEAVLKKCKPQHIERTYGIRGCSSAAELLDSLAKKAGRLLKGGEADVDGVAKMVLNDFLRGKIPWYTPPPKLDGEDGEEMEGRTGRLGEMGGKRKRDDLSEVMDRDDINVDDEGSEGEETEAGEEESSDEFQGFKDSEGGVSIGLSEDDISSAPIDPVALPPHG